MGAPRSGADGLIFKRLSLMPSGRPVLADDLAQDPEKLRGAVADFDLEAVTAFRRGRR